MEQYTFSNDKLESWRSVGDPLADGVMRDLYEMGSVTAVNDLLGLMVRHDVPPPAQLPPAAQRYFLQTAELPPWADLVAITRGEEVFMRYGLLSLASLLCASLPECYAMRNGVQVLDITRQLRSNTEHRVYETAQMVIDVMARGGLRPGGRGVRAAQKVRLMHASMRYLLEIDPNGVTEPEPALPTLADVMTRKVWNPSWGRPINQEDMAFTLQTFSTVVLRSWERLGVVLDPQEREGYFHCWRVVGHVLGLDEELNPATVEGGAALFEAARAHQRGATEPGRAMTRALADTIAQVIGIPWVSDDAVTLLMRHLLDDDTAEMMGVPEVSKVGSLAMSGLVSVVRAASAVGEGIGDEVPLVHRISAWFGQRFVERIARRDRGGERSLFNLPSDLRAAWER